MLDFEVWGSPSIGLGARAPHPVLDVNEDRRWQAAGGERQRCGSTRGARPERWVRTTERTQILDE